MSKETSKGKLIKEVLKELPAFVYGTLRNGLGNYHGFLDGNTDKEVMATLEATLHLTGGGGIPGIKHGEGTVVGELMYITPELYPYVMQHLDRLEGNGWFYDREEVTVTTVDGEKVQAWTYFYHEPNRLGAVISHGDYKKFISDIRKSNRRK